MDTNTVDIQKHTAPAPPEPAGEEPAVPAKQNNLKAGTQKDRVGFHSYATTRYRGCRPQGSQLIKFQFDGRIDETINTDILEGIRTDPNAAKFLNRYEAWSVPELTVSVQYSDNFIVQQGQCRTGYVRDPERKEVPTLDDVNDDDFNINGYLRVQDGRSQRAGDSYVYNIPVSQNKFYTGFEGDRFTSPGRFFITALTTERDLTYNDPNSTRGDYPQRIITVTGRILGYVQTIRTQVQTVKQQFIMGEIATDWSVKTSDYTDFLKLDFKSLPGAFWGIYLPASDIYSNAYPTDPMLAHAILVAADDEDPEKYQKVEISFPLSKFKMRQNQEPLEYHFSCDISQVLGLNINAEDLEVELFELATEGKVVLVTE